MFGYIIKKPLFPIGKVLIAPEIIALGVDTESLLRRHQYGDFGFVDQYNIDQNHNAIESGNGILSQYHVMVSEEKFLICVMTENDRSFTVIFSGDKYKHEFMEEPENGNNSFH